LPRNASQPIGPRASARGGRNDYFRRFERVASTPGRPGRATRRWVTRRHAHGDAPGHPSTEPGVRHVGMRSGGRVQLAVVELDAPVRVVGLPVGGQVVDQGTLELPGGLELMAYVVPDRLPRAPDGVRRPVELGLDLSQGDLEPLALLEELASPHVSVRHTMPYRGHDHRVDRGQVPAGAGQEGVGGGELVTRVRGIGTRRSGGGQPVCEYAMGCGGAGHECVHSRHLLRPHMFAPDVPSLRPDGRAINKNVF
jgi:hypothetical protein